MTAAKASLKVFSSSRVSPRPRLCPSASAIDVSTVRHLLQAMAGHGITSQQTGGGVLRTGDSEVSMHSAATKSVRCSSSGVCPKWCDRSVVWMC